MTRSDHCTTATVLAVAAALVAGPTAAAHSPSTGHSPRSDASVSAGLSRITVSFGARIAGGRVVVVGPRGRVSGHLVVRARRLDFHPYGRLTRGRHRVGWRAIASNDGHRQSGSFRFRVR